MSPIRVRLKELREAAGLTQAALADLAGLRQATVNDIENGNTKGMDYATLDKLCRALKCDPSDLLVRDRR